MRAVRLALSLIVSLGFVTSATAQDQLTTVSGQVFDGKIISSDGTTVEFQTEEGMTMKLPVENLTPVSQYMLKRSQVSDTEESQLALAEWCVKETLYLEARRHYQMALKKATPEEKTEIDASIAKARTTAANELLERAKTLQENNRPEDARQVLVTIVQELPEEAAAKEASAMLEQDNDRKKASALKKPNTAAPADGAAAPTGTPPTRASGEEFSQEAQTLFAPVVKLYQSILDNTQKGLSSTNQSQSISAYQAALKDGDRARKEVDKLRPKGSTDAEVQEAVQLVDSKLESAIVDARIQLSNAYMLRSSYTQAADVVKAGLAEYPQNERLNQSMGTVISAQSNDSWGGGGWIIRGGGVPRPSHQHPGSGGR
jgi:hypothetical protein